MKVSTRDRKKATRGFEGLFGRQELIDRLYRIISKGKQGLDTFLLMIGGMIAEAIMYIEREEISGPDYRPCTPGLQKWASQKGSIYLGDQKIRVEHPRLRKRRGEVVLKSYEKLKEAGAFSEELLEKVLPILSLPEKCLPLHQKLQDKAF